MGRVPTEEDKVYSVHCLGNSQAIVPEFTYPTYVQEDFPFNYPISCSASLSINQLSFIS
jgi:hypothetical protein